MRYIIIAIILCFASPAEAGKNIPPQPPKKTYQLKGTWKFKSTVSKTCWDKPPKTCFSFYNKFPGYPSGMSAYVDIKGSITFSSNTSGTVTSNHKSIIYYPNQPAISSQWNTWKETFKVVKRKDKTILQTINKGKTKEQIVEIKNKKLTLTKTKNTSCSSRSGRCGPCTNYTIDTYTK